MKYLNLIFFIISFQTFAQKEKYVGIELGTSKDQFEVLYLTSFGNGFFVDKNKSRSNNKALLLGIKLNNQFSFETGFRTKIYGQDFKIENTYSSFNDTNTPFYTLSSLVSTKI